MSDIGKITHATFHLDRAADFVDRLWQSQIASEAPYQQAIFRGHSDERWDLKPFAYRSDGERRLKKLLRIGGNRRSNNDVEFAGTHELAEIAALSMFYKFANDQALLLPPLPGPWHQALLTSALSMSTYSALALLSGKLGSWPPSDVLPALGLAQHYGVPTRLLDWTSDCHVAAYFAATSALRALGKGADRLAVWCASRGVIEAASPGLDTGNLRPSYKIRLVEVPYAGNPNLAAQKGVFSVVIPSGHEKSTTFDRTTIDQAYSVIRGEFSGHDLEGLLFRRFGDGPAFLKLTLPVSEARELLVHLHRRGFDGSRLFPGYQGCEIAMQELELLESSVPDE